MKRHQIEENQISVQVEIKDKRIPDSPPTLGRKKACESVVIKKVNLKTRNKNFSQSP